jgi:TRAP-type C4-dicarboxylate transport system substrate-binding protein
LKESEDKIKQELMAKGMEIMAPADDEKEWISKATTQVWPKFYESIGGKAKLDQALKAIGR